MLTIKNGRIRNTFRNTKILQADGVLSVRLHGTEIVRIDTDGDIRLSSGGWHTVTTKKRLNEVAKIANLDFAVYQEDFSWYVRFEGVDIPFEDGMIIQRDGVVVTPC